MDKSKANQEERIKNLRQEAERLESIKQEMAQQLQVSHAINAAMKIIVEDKEKEVAAARKAREDQKRSNPQK